MSETSGNPNSRGFSNRSQQTSGARSGSACSARCAVHMALGTPEPLGATTLCLIDFDVLARERKSGYHGSKFTCAESEGGAVMSGSLGRMVNVNGVTYVWPQRPVIVVCIDGGDPEYLETCLSDGLIPNLEGFMKRGFHNIAEGVVPSLTNPNNISIVTGSPPSVHGISGNYFLDPETGMGSDDERPGVPAL